MAKREFRMIDTCPCPIMCAPQVFMVLRKAKQTASSIYRSADAEYLLNPHGKHSQPQLYELSLHGTPQQREAAGLPPGGGGVNKPGTSEHELRSDGVGKKGPLGRVLADWQVGVDSGQNTDAQRTAIQAAAASFGWKVEHHYGAGIERHHWCFVEPPRPRNPWQRIKIGYYRAKLPKK